ncbi:hypothetical protein ES707_21035 [subsurface metagenome]
MNDENCVLGLDPLDCPHRSACRYWSRLSECCKYRAIKDQERKLLHIEKFDSFDEAVQTIKIDKRRMAQP